MFFFSFEGLKELYTSETTFALKIVLTPLNNKFIIKIWNSTSFMLKNPQIFLQKEPEYVISEPRFDVNIQ